MITKKVPKHIKSGEEVKYNGSKYIVSGFDTTDLVNGGFYFTLRDVRTGQYLTNRCTDILYFVNFEAEDYSGFISNCWINQKRVTPASRLIREL